MTLPEVESHGTTARGAAAVATATLIFGTGSIMVKLVTASGLVTSTFRLWFGAAALVAISLIRGRRITWRHVKLAAFGGVLFGVHQVFFTVGLKHTSVANVTLVAALQPALVLVVAGPWFGERVTGRHILWTAVAIAGVTLVVVGGTATPTVLGVGFAVANLFAWTAYFLATKRVRTEVDPLDFMVGMTITAAICVTLLALTIGEDFGTVSGPDWFWLVMLALIPGTVGHTLLTWSHQEVEASVSSLILLGMPLVAVIMAAVFLDEPLTWLDVVGSVIVLGSIGAIVRGGQRPETAETLAETAAETGTT